MRARTSVGAVEILSHLKRATVCAALGSALFCLPGCAGNPSAANIQLRKDNQKLQEKVTDLDRRHAADLPAGHRVEPPALVKDRRSSHRGLVFHQYG